MASVSLHNLHKSFKDTHIIKNVSLEIRDKEFLVLVGPSGCGKSTCLRMIAGLEDVSAGEIRIGDRLVNNVTPKDRDIAMVFQSYALYPHMTVYQNLAFGLRLRTMGGTFWKMTHHKEVKQRQSEIRSEVERVAELLDLGHLLDRKPRQLSGGQNQRVALGRAIARQPQVFLMDEPLSNLDAKLRVQTRAELIKLHRRLGITTIYVTHDQVEAMTMGDRIAVLKDGVLQQCDTPLNLFHHPANMFVASFIGSPSMNMIPAKVVTIGEELKLDAGAFQLAVPANRVEALKPYTDKEVVFGVRPSEIFGKNYLPPDVQAHEGNIIRARCEVTEPMGDRTFLFLSAGGQQLIADVAAETRAAEEQDVDLVIATGRTHVFDPTTEKAIY